MSDDQLTAYTVVMTDPEANAQVNILYATDPDAAAALGPDAANTAVKGVTNACDFTVVAVFRGTLMPVYQMQDRGGLAQAGN